MNSKYLLNIKYYIMNRSFSKIRHIQEANKRLEERLLNEQQADRSYREYAGGPVIYVFGNEKFTFDPKTNKYVPYLTEEEKVGWTDEKKKLYACVYNNSSKSKISQIGGFTINGVVYYSNGRYGYPSIGTGSYSCDGDKIVRKNIDKIAGQTPAASAGSTTTPASGEVPASSAENNVKSKKTGGIQYQHCPVIDGLYKSCYNEKHVKRLQSCLGLTGRNMDGYFGNTTENTLYQKFPEYKGKKIFTPDIDKICGVEPQKQLDPGTGVMLPQDQNPVSTTAGQSSVGSAGQAADNLDPTEVTTTQPSVVQNQQNTPTTQTEKLPYDVLKKQAEIYQVQFNKMKKSNPRLSNREIADKLAQQGVILPRA